MYSRGSFYRGRGSFRSVYNRAARKLNIFFRPDGARFPMINYNLVTKKSRDSVRSETTRSFSTTKTRNFNDDSPRRFPVLT